MMDDRNKSYIANSKHHGNGNQEMSNNISRSLAHYRTVESLGVSTSSPAWAPSHDTTINPDKIVKDDTLLA